MEMTCRLSVSAHEITVSNSDLQTLRDIIDELLITQADIEENS